MEFSDFECPFCSRVNPTISKILKEYAGKVSVVWRHNPLPMHPNAPLAHQASAEAHAQGGSDKFWAMHDKLFANQKALDRGSLEKYAKEIGLNVGKFKAALDSGKHKAKVEADKQLAAKVGARGTPFFAVNGRSIPGAQPFEKFKEVIDDEIKRAEQLTASGTKRGNLYAAFMQGAKDSPAPAAQKPQAPPRAQPDPKAVYRVPVDKEPWKGSASPLGHDRRGVRLPVPVLQPRQPHDQADSLNVQK